MQQVRLWAGHLLACLVLLLPVAPVQAAAVYQYTFTSGVLADPEWTQEFLGERFTIGFSLPTALGTGNLDTTGVWAWGQVSSARFSFPHPPPQTEWVPNPYEPGEWEQPVYPYISSGFSLFVGSIGPDGLPVTWQVGIGQTEYFDSRSGYVLGLHSRYEGPDIWFNEDVFGGETRSVDTIARNTVVPGAWSVTIAEVPEPSTLLLLGCTGLMLLGVRSRAHH